jgi:hypothetical protein
MSKLVGMIRDAGGNNIIVLPVAEMGYSSCFFSKFLTRVVTKTMVIWWSLNQSTCCIPENTFVSFEVENLLFSCTYC